MVRQNQGNEMLSRSRLGVLSLVALALLGCGGNDNNGSSSGNGGNSGAVVTPARQYGVTENELYDPVNHKGGIVVGHGSGLVTLQLEPPAGPPAPLVGDTAVVALDEMWFDVDKKGSVNLTLTEQNLAAVSRLEITNANGALLLWADTAQRQATGQLEPGRYRLRLRAAPAGTAAVSVWVWLGGAPSQTNDDDLSRLSTGNCVDCYLAGADLTGYKLRGINLAGADLRQAVLASVPGGLSLAGTDLMTIYIGGGDSTGMDGADLSGTNLTAARLDGAIMSGPGNSPANLSGANLIAASMTDLYLPYANLSGASLSGAKLSRSVLTQAVLRGANLAGAVMLGVDLTGADLSASNLAGTDFTGARLDGAIWNNGQTCAAGSIGVCR